jgi:hypothetical protein
VFKLTITNTGTVGVPGWVELRDAEATPGDNGTLRWRSRFLSADEQVQDIDFGGDMSDSADGLTMPQGIRVTFGTGLTNTEVWVGWDG